MSFARKGVLDLLVTGAVTTVNFVVGILLARFLSPDGLGQFSLATTVATIVAFGCTVGLGQAGVYYINNQKRPIDEVSTNLLRCCVALGLLVAAILFSLLGFKEFFGEMPLWVVFTVLVFGVCTLANDILGYVLIAVLDISKLSIVRTMTFLVPLVLITCNVLFGHLTVNLALAYFSAGVVSAFVALLFFIRRQVNFRAPFVWGRLRELLRYGLKMNLSGLMFLLNGELGILVMRFLASDFAEVAFYKIAARLGGVLLLVPYSLGPLFFSKWSSMESATDKSLEAERLSRFYFALILVAVLVLEMMVAWLVPFVFGEAYVASVPIMQVFLIGVIAKFMMAPLFSLFSSGGRPLFISLVLASTVVFMTILMVVLVPTLRGVGAAWAFTGGNFLGLALAYALSGKVFDVQFYRCFLVTKTDLKMLKSTAKGLVFGAKS